jgi:mersacidin/lichenicidin family type 2 lantibiotic
MKTEDVIRAWKDAEFRAELSAEERALLPQNPAGLVQLTDEALEDVVGGDSCLCWSCNAPAEQEAPQEVIWV